MMSRDNQDELQYVEEWRENVIRRGEHHVHFGQRSYVISNRVFSPAPDLTYSSSILLNQLGDCNGLRVLDVGTGSGVLAIEAVFRGAAKVVATDNSVAAINCAKQNAKRLGVSDVIEFRRCDLMRDVEGYFDLILANLPIYMDGGGRTLWEAFFRSAKNYLKSEGRLLFAWASFGDTDQMERVIRQNGYYVLKNEEIHHNVRWCLYDLRTIEYDQK